MKASFTAALGMVLLWSCSKNSAPRQQITGQWELRKEVGGFAGTIQYEPGTGTSFTFNNNKTFQVIYPNTPLQKGTYEIAPSANAGDWILSLHIKTTGQDMIIVDSIRFDKNQFLVLPIASCCDIPTSYYEHLR